ncbi:unnamed protein product, partial [Closterium sp. NIES-54]
ALLWHHRLGHPSLPRLRGMHSRLLVSGLPRSLPSLPRLLAPPCLPCVEGRQRAVPHFSFPPTTAPLQTLHMDVWGPARITGQGGERYFLLVVNDYTPYTMVFPLQSKAEDLPILRLHSDRGGDFSSRLLEDFCGAEGITQSFTLPASPQQNGIAEPRIGFVIDVSVAVCGPIRRAPAQPLAPCLPPGDQTYSVVVGRESLTESREHASRPVTPICIRPCLLAGDLAYTALDGEDWRCVGVPVPFYHLFPYRSAPPPPPPLFLAPGPPPVDPLPPQGPAPSGVSQVDPLPGTAPIEVAIGSGAARGTVSGGAESEGAGSGGAEPGGAGSGGAEPGGAKPGGVEHAGVEPGGVEPGGA